MVPRLKEVHVVWDSWTKLNVIPAKIMQVKIACTQYVILTSATARTGFGRILTIDYLHISSNQKSFFIMAVNQWLLFYTSNFYITWDLLQIDIYSFRAFYKDFFEKHPGYFVSPLSVSGSAIESLFSQFKCNAGGKLDSCNYVTARCAHLVQQCASGYHSGISYRDEHWNYLFTRKHKEIHRKIIKCICYCFLIVNNLV